MHSTESRNQTPGCLPLAAEQNPLIANIPVGYLLYQGGYRVDFLCRDRRGSVHVRPNVRGERFPAVRRQARELDDRQHRLAG